MLYLAQVASPIRVNIDAYRLLSMAESAYNGEGYLVDGSPDRFPILYPMLVKTLMQLDIADSHVIISLNLIFLFGFIYFFHQLFKIEKNYHCFYYIIFILLSWVCIKHVTLPLTDMGFMFFSGASLLLLKKVTWYNKIEFICFLTFSILLALIATGFRSIGMALFPAIAYAGGYSFIKQMRFKLRKADIFIYSCLLSIVLLIVVLGVKTQWFKDNFISSNGYFYDIINKIHTDGFLSFFMTNIGYRVLEFGEIATNLPLSKFSFLLPLYIVAGLIMFATTIYGCYKLFVNSNTSFLSVYFISYSAIMLTWPFYDSRFWLPVLPFIFIGIMSLLDNLKSYSSYLKYIAICYFSIYAIVGMIALGYSTQISLSGNDISEYYGNGNMIKMTYRKALNNGYPVNRKHVDKKIVHIIRRFERNNKHSDE